MGITAYHAFTSPIVDGTDTQIVRPSNWNASHILSYDGLAGTGFSGTNISGTVDSAGISLSVNAGGGAGFTAGVSTGGNTSGQTGTVSNQVVFYGGNNVTLSQQTGAGGATVVMSVPNFQSQGAYLTTAAQSNHSHGAISFNLTNVNASATSASNGLTLNLSAAPTAAQTQQPMYFSASGTNTSASTLQFGNTQGVSFGLSNGSVVATVATNYQSQGAYLTTAALSGDTTKYAGISSGTQTTAGTNIVMTHNTAGLNLGVPKYLTTAQPVGAYLTTAMASDAGSAFQYTSNTSAITSNAFPSANTTKFAGTGTSATNASVTLNSNGIAISVAAPGGGGAVNFSAGTTSGNLQSVTFANSNGISFGLSNGVITGTVATNYQSQGAYLTTAALSGDTTKYAGISSGTQSIAGSDLAMTHNTAGLNLGVPKWLTTAQPVGAYLTTARASNDALGLNTALTANGVSMTANSSGLSLNFPAFLTTAAQSNHSHGNPTLALTNLSGTTASASNGFTLSLSAAAPGGGGAINVSAGTTSGNLQTVQFNNANGVSFGLSGSTVTASVNAGGGAAPKAYYAIPPWGGVSALISNATAVDKRAFFVPFQNLGDLSVQEIMWPMSRSTAGSNAFTVQAGIFSYANSSRLDLVSSQQNVYSHTATASISGIRLFEVVFDNSFTIPPGQYAVGMWFSANAGNTVSMNYSLMGGTTSNMYSNVIHPGTDQYFTHTTHQAIPMFGRHSVTSASLPTSMAAADLYGAYTGASMPIPMAFTIGTHN